MVEYQHFILTPFCVRRQMTTNETRCLPSAIWVAERLKIFERYCLPSIVNQTDSNFDWLIFFDPETNPEGLEAFRKLIAPFPNIHLRFCSSWTKTTLVAAVRKELKPGIEWVLTTRLDNDDGWHEKFAAELHAAVRPGTRELLNFTKGFIVSGAKVYGYEHPSNAFISFSEPVRDFNTPVAISHELLGTLACVRQITAPPMFYQLVHGNNVSNKVRGIRTPIAVALEGFTNLRHALPEKRPEGKLAIGIENATIGTARALRDRAANVYKRVRRRMY